MSAFFNVSHSDSDSCARAGTLSFHKKDRLLSIETPVFMPVGTAATVKGIWHSHLEEIGYQLILGNTYHLYLRPGVELVRELNGLGNFQSWNGALLTDSGGYQVYSLADRVRFQEEGVEFASHIDGSRHLFTPESVLNLQVDYGSDIMMVLDDCPPADADETRLEQALERTHRWARSAIGHYEDLVSAGRINPEQQRLFGIVQGGISLTHREASLNEIQSLNFAGIAIGGLSVGEVRELMYNTLEYLGPRLDPTRPRYLMGVGAIPDILEAVRNGVDMFDCVLPTRNARNAQLITHAGPLRIRNRQYADDPGPVDPQCECQVCKRYSRAYLRHLFQAGEMLGPMLATYHNLHFYKKFMADLRAAIISDRFAQFYSFWKKIQF